MPKKELIRPNLACGCDHASVCALMLPPVGRGFTSQCFVIGAYDWAAAIGERVPDSV